MGLSWYTCCNTHIFAGRRASVKESCTKYFEGCEEILDENRKAGNAFIIEFDFQYYDDVLLFFNLSCCFRFFTSIRWSLMRKRKRHLTSSLSFFWVKLKGMLFWFFNVLFVAFGNQSKPLTFSSKPTFRYSTMLAENLVDAVKPGEKQSPEHHRSAHLKGVDEDIIDKYIDANVGGYRDVS